MLVLSRKQGQSIKISDQITITVTQVKGKQVRIGIDAPREMKIRRGELAVLENSIVEQGVATLTFDSESSLIRCPLPS